MLNRGKYGEKEGEEWCSEVLDPRTDEARKRITHLRSSERVTTYDTIDSQLSEYVKLSKPDQTWSDEEFVENSRKLLKSEGVESPDFFGNWVHYPWINRLVHVLPETMFAYVRTDRNRNKITTLEQGYVSVKKVGVIGMSVGRSVATTMALERIFGELRLADYDRLDLSNLNRLKAPVWDLGVRKTVSAARDILETDPYLSLTLFHEGITRENIGDFIMDGGKLDVIVDECDSLEIKVLSREIAKRHGIPVVMETSDRGMLDVERFDLEPNRPIFHGRLEGFDIWNDLKNPESRWKMLMTLVDFDNLSRRAKVSLPEIGKTISTWPQLASAVVLGGGTVTDAVRKILLSEGLEFGRYYYDFHTSTSSYKNEVG